MTTVQITFDAQEGGSFDDQHQAFIRELRTRGLVVSQATERKPNTHSRDTSEITIHLLEPGITLQDTVADIRHSAGKCLHGTLPNHSRRLTVYGPQGQHLLELQILQDQSY